MPQYIFDIKPTINLVSYIVKIDALSKSEAVKKYKKLGFNAGLRLSETFRPLKGEPILLEVRP